MGSPYRRITYMPDGQKRFVWRCLNRIEHGKRICKHSATLDEIELQDAATTALNEMFRQREARKTLAQCVAAALARVGDNGSPAVETQLRALQEEQMSLFRLAATAGPENTEYDDRMVQVNAAMMELTARKIEVEREGGAGPVYDSRVRAITDTLEQIGSAIEGFNEGLVFQMVSRVTVLDKERLTVRFKDGTKMEQTVGHIDRRASA